MKKLFYTICFSFILIFSACVSKPLPIPGDTSRTINNIYIEYMNIADTYMKLENYKNAADYYKLAMQNRKLYWACYYKLALCYVYTSDWKSAEPMYSTMLKRDSENASLKASLAYIYSMNGNLKKSIKLYDDLLESQPDNEAYLSNYLIILLSDEKTFNKYKNNFEEIYAKLNEFYPDNSNLKKITEKYEEFTETEEEAESEEDAEENSDIEASESEENEASKDT